MNDINDCDDDEGLPTLVRLLFSIAEEVNDFAGSLQTSPIRIVFHPGASLSSHDGNTLLSPTIHTSIVTCMIDEVRLAQM